MKTKHAWYIVGKPSPAYAQIFSEFELVHELTYALLSSCLQDHQVTVSAFRRRIQTEYPPDVVQSFEDSLRDDDKVSWKPMANGYNINDLQVPFVIQLLMDLPYAGINNIPLIQSLFPGLGCDEDLLEEVPVLDQPPVTVITPRVDQVCGRLFKYYQNFRVEGHSPIKAGSSVKRAVEVHGPSPRIRWVSDEITPGFYKSVRVDNELYQVSALLGSLSACL